jgi:hypothetical protein
VSAVGYVGGACAQTTKTSFEMQNMKEFGQNSSVDDEIEENGNGDGNESGSDEELLSSIKSELKSKLKSGRSVKARTMTKMIGGFKISEEEDEEEDRVEVLPLEKESLTLSENETTAGSEDGSYGEGAVPPIFAYAHQHGLFLSLLSLEGAIIVPRSNVNRLFYGSLGSRSEEAAGDGGGGGGVPFGEPTPDHPRLAPASPTPHEILSGLVPPPAAAAPLYSALIDAFDGTAEVDDLVNALSVE